MTTARRYAIALTAALGMVLPILDNTIVSVALPAMGAELRGSLGAMQWVVTGYFMTQAGVIPVAGYFSDRVGIRRLFLICLALFMAGSCLCAAATSPEWLVVFRVVQGLGGGALIPLTQAIAFGAFEERDRVAAAALVGIPVLLAPAFGPPLGGWLTVQHGWRMIFLINLPLGLVALALAWRLLPADPARAVTEARARFDLPGLLLSILGVLAVVAALALLGRGQMGARGVAWQSGALLLLGAALLVGFAVHALRGGEDAVLDLRLFLRPAFTRAGTVAWFAAVVVFASLFLLPLFFQHVRTPPLSALDAGLALMPQGLASVAGVALSGPLYRRVGARTLAVVGLVGLAISSWGLGSLTVTSDGATPLPWLIVRGLTFGLLVVSAQTKAMEGIGGAALARASSLFNVMRQLFSSVGLAGAITLFVQRSAAHAGLGEAGAGTAAMNEVFRALAVATVAMVALALVIPREPT